MESNKENIKPRIIPKNHKKKKTIIGIGADFLTPILFFLILVGGAIFMVFASNNGERVCMLQENYIQFLNCKQQFCESKGWDSTYPVAGECKDHKSPDNEIHCLVTIPERDYYEKRIFYFEEINTVCGGWTK